jgi:glutamine synthetase
MAHDPAKLEAIRKLVADQKIEFVNLQFTDIHGMLKSVGVPINMFWEAIDHGMWFDGSSIQGFTRIAESDMLLHPDLDTFARIPWDVEIPTARVICDVCLPSGEPFEGDPRGVLKRQLERVRAMGYEYITAPELEFFLFKPHADGSLLPLKPHDNARYFDMSTDMAHDVRRRMVHALQAFGITVEALHHEVAIGQHEIDFKYGPALQTADNAMTLKTTFKAIAQEHGLFCSFMPKPIGGENGNGMHVHQSLWKDGKNVFGDPNDPHGMSKVAKHFIAGQLEHAKEMSAVIAPLVNSYKRLVPGYEAPVYISWASSNRSALIRIPRVSKTRIATASRIELRCPDPSSNPYLTFAAMLAAGIDGMERKLEAPKAQEEDLFHLSPSRRSRLVSMPGSLGEAIGEFRRSKLMKQAFGEHLFRNYIEAKTAEWDSYRTSISQWELDNYLSIY